MTANLSDSGAAAKKTDSNKFLSFLEASRRPLLSDGAMGTILHQRGVTFDACFDELNLTDPGLVGEIHREYIDAGSQIIQANTFGANRFKLSKHGLEGRVEEINRKGVELARRMVMASFKDVFIAGDVGPLGVRLAPFGRVQPEQARQAFEEQIGALTAADVDLLIIETMTDLYEVKEAILAARQVSPQTPIIASMTYTRDDRTLLGDEPSKVASVLSQAGADLIGVNCSGGPNQILRILRQMKQAVPEGLFSVMPNAGWPEQVAGRIMYPAAPEYFGEYALNFWQAGASVIGGCCGTTPQHIASMSSAIKSAPENFSIQIQVPSVAAESSEEDTHEPPTRFAQKLSKGEFVIAVEMDPPRGLSTHKLLAGAGLLSDSGVDVINVADSPMARMRMSPWAVCDLVQRKVGAETVLHFPTRGRNLIRVQGDLLAAHAIGVRHIFVVMGDPTSIGDYPDAMDNYDLVPSGLIKLIKQGFNAGIDHAGSNIGQPTSFFVGGALNLIPPDPETEIKNLRRKVRAGVDFLLTQPIFDAVPAEAFLNRCREELGSLPPVLIGFLPLANSRHANFLHHEVPGITIPENIRDYLEKHPADGPRAGIDITVDLISKTRSFSQGAYIMPAFGRYDYVAEIIEKINGKTA
jgi:methionine synthase I (cobalamin-dependent)/5,10-methylenetetrahydrofolate reductase